MTAVTTTDAERSSRRRFAPAIAWGALMLLLTSLPGRAIPAVPVAHIDKLVHATMYAILAALVASAIAGPRRARALAGVVAFASLYGAADEWHQQFIPGRSQDRVDWAADTVGAALGVLFIAAARARREHTT